MTTMTRLRLLRSKLARLRRRRRLERLLNASSALAIAVLVAAAAIFALDWVFEMSHLQRVLLVAIGAVGIVWACVRYVRPFLGHCETILDMALLVEKKQHIDSDLVAALEFDSAGANWGSRQLTAAVVDYVDAFTRDLDVFKGFSNPQLTRRILAVTITACVVGGAAALFPVHASVFLDRIVLGSTHYPTDTVIDGWAVNGRELTIDGGDAAEDVRFPYGRPLEFELRCVGRLPEIAHIELRPASGQHIVVELDRLLDEANEDAGVYRGTLPRLTEALEYQVYAGDAWTDPARFDVMPLPVVELTLAVTPPDYAIRSSADARAAAEESTAGSRHISVLEGSRIEVKVRCANKRLRQATFSAGGKNFPLVRSAGATDWRLPPEGTPLERVRQSLHYRIEARDEDGLDLEAPIEGSIRLEPDRKPRVSAAAVTQLVLPSARPTISYGAVDDHGLAKLAVEIEVRRQDEPVRRQEVLVAEVSASPEPVTVVRDRYTLDLEPLGLEKGDRVLITVVALDYRGRSEGESSASEPMELIVTDQRGVLSAMIRSDERSVEQLDAIIERQLGIGKK